MNNRKHKLKYFRKFPTLAHDAWKPKFIIIWPSFKLGNGPIPPSLADNILTGELGTFHGITYTLSETVKNTRYYRNKDRVRLRKFVKDYPAIAFMKDSQSVAITRKFLLSADTGPFTFEDIYVSADPNLG